MIFINLIGILHVALNQTTLKAIKISLLLLILLISTSCEKDVIKDPPYSLALDLQSGFWESENPDEVAKFDGTYFTFYSLCVDDICSPNFPCIHETITWGYTLEGNTIYITFPNGVTDPFPIKIEVDVLTLDNDFIYERKETLGYSDCP